MLPHHRVRFCPRCAGRLIRRDDHGSPRPTCVQCGYIYYRNPVPAAGVLLAWRGELLMVRRKYDPRAGAWCLPAGFMEYGETPPHCALRELREETGIRGRLGDLFGVYAGHDDPRVHAVLILYTAERNGGRLTPGDDAIEARFFAPARLPRSIAFEAHRRALMEYRARLRSAGKS
jgi:8-oxo-dGTP diphosphatase